MRSSQHFLLAEDEHVRSRETFMCRKLVRKSHDSMLLPIRWNMAIP